ncbi:MAG: hypothetical protein Q4G63_12910, partial [Bacteroidia bacterium]|nr:hypothetical protein [Bacteroidia bacterium]
MLSCCYTTITAQCFDFYRKTPNGTNVKACRGGGYSAWQVQQADTYSRTFAIEVLEAGTDSYNCHAYAWHIREGGDKVWINNMGAETHNVNNYWLDNSYYSVAFQSGVSNIKVFYGSTSNSSDHSAITTIDPNVFISKMGCGALVKHYKNNSPYNSSNLTYYIRNLTSFTISGPSVICTEATYTIENLLPGATVQWSTSNNNDIKID